MSNDATQNKEDVIFEGSKCNNLITVIHLNFKNDIGNKLSSFGVLGKILASAW